MFLEEKKHISEIAREYGVSWGVINSRINQMGIEKPKRKRIRRYVLIFNKDGSSQTEQRFVMEKHLRRKLTDKERVHHINCIKTDNRIENLYLCDMGANRSIHGKLTSKLERFVKPLMDLGLITFKNGEYHIDYDNIEIRRKNKNDE